MLCQIYLNKKLINKNSEIKKCKLIIYDAYNQYNKSLEAFKHHNCFGALQVFQGSWSKPGCDDCAG